MEKAENLNLIHLSEIKNINDSNNNDKIIIENKNANDRKKYYYIFDNFKGILIFMVVFTHFLLDYSNSDINSSSRKIVVFIYIFHMQSFTFISGFLSSENSIKFINAIKLIILYYIFNFSISLILYFYINAPINFLYPYYSYWYILSLFYWRISIKFLNKISFIFTFSIMTSLLEGYWDCFSNILSISKTIAFFPYFIAGYKIEKIKIIDKIISLKKDKIKFIIFLISFLSFSYLVILYITNQQISDATLQMCSYNESNHIQQRILIVAFSFIMISFFIILLPNNKIIIINKWGKNSLYIYLFHRIFTIIVQREFFTQKIYSEHIIKYSLLFTLIILFLFGIDIFAKFCNSILNTIHKNIIKDNGNEKRICNIFCFSFILLLMIKPISINYNKFKLLHKDIPKQTSFQQKQNILNENVNDLLDNSIRISYVGDLILLKDNVIGAKNNSTGKYEFDGMFQYTSKHFHESDLSIGVFEGPSAGNNTSFSTSNYDDGIPLFLNFPDEFAEAIKRAGINLVTTANNHLLDKDLEGAMRTLDILDQLNITHVGSYRNKDEQNKICTINIKGIKIAVLAFTSIMNNYKMETLYEKYKYLTNIIPTKDNIFYNQIYRDIENEFYKAKKISSDIILVLVHMGDEFLHHTTKFQDEWNKILSGLGADIILGDHSHAVQPLQYIGNTLIINCPGNFANSYIKGDGDSTAIIDIYIHKQSKKIIGASAIPMYTKELKPKYFSAIPIYDLIHNDSIVLSAIERKRVEEIQLMSTKVLVGREFKIKEAKAEYFFINNSYFELKREKTFCDKLYKYSKNEVYKLISNTKSITFIGDSITEGTKNGYHPWYEPMIKCFPKKKIINISKGSYTTKLIINKYKNELINSQTDLYIIALGTNDIRYRDSSICAMDPNDYINQIEKIVNLVEKKEKKIIFIAPWFSTYDDNISKLNYGDKTKLMKNYSLELKKFAERNNFTYINPNDYIQERVDKNKRKYMEDFIHPNNKTGIELYCEGIFVSFKPNT